MTTAMCARRFARSPAIRSLERLCWPDPHVMANLLKDLLPDLPRESALLVAAAQCDLAGVLSGHLAQGLDLGTSSRLAAGWFAGRMPFTDDVCAWVVAELAIALGADPAALDGATLATPSP